MASFAHKEKQRREDDDLALWQYRNAPDKHVLTEWIESAEKKPRRQRQKWRRTKFADTDRHYPCDQPCGDLHQSTVATIQTVADQEEHCCDRWDDVGCCSNVQAAPDSDFDSEDEGPIFNTKPLSPDAAEEYRKQKEADNSKRRNGSKNKPASRKIRSGTY